MLTVLGLDSGTTYGYDGYDDYDGTLNSSECLVPNALNYSLFSFINKINIFSLIKNEWQALQAKLLRDSNPIPLENCDLLMDHSSH